MESRMFVDFQNGWPPPEPWEPKPKPPRMTKRAETLTTWIIGFNLAMLVIGPLAGVTVFDALRVLWGK
jgi:hypothetical protein